MASAQKIGMMDPAYFLGRREILDFMNTVCSTNLAKVEESASGAIACQLLDAIYPGKVPMSKVDWLAKDQYQYTANYKVLQGCFSKMHIDKPINMEKLIRGRYQDNMEFMQWFKAFYDLNATGVDYDAVARRNKGKGGSAYSAKHGGGASAPRTAPAKKNPPPSAPARSRSASVKETSSSSSSVSRTASAMESKRDDTLQQLEDELNEKDQVIMQLRGANNKQATNAAEMQTSMDELEKERDFYFHKLRAVEVHLQDLDDANNNLLVQDILQILYEVEGEPVAAGESNEQSAGLTEESTEKNMTNLNLNVTPEEVLNNNASSSSVE